MNTGYELYSFMRSNVNARKTNQNWNYSQVERYVNDNFYAFSRGNLLVAVTNQKASSYTINVTYHPYSAGEVVCNIFYTSDCVTVDSSKGVPVTLTNGEPKAYLPKSHSFFTESADLFLQE